LTALGDLGRGSSAPPEGVGELIDSLEDTIAAERPVGRLRLVAAVASLVGALYVVYATGGGPLSMGFLGIVVVAAAFWWRRFSDVERGVVANKRRTLFLGRDGVALLDGSATRLVPWAEVKRLELDHDRMLVQLVLAEGTLDLEPPFGGLGLEALGQRVLRARGLSNAPRGAHDPQSPSA
jgi:Bacterial PH domain